MILEYGVDEDAWRGTSLEPLIIPVKVLKAAAVEIEELLPSVDDCEDWLEDNDDDE